MRFLKSALLLLSFFLLAQGELQAQTLRILPLGNSVTAGGMCTNGDIGTCTPLGGHVAVGYRQRLYELLDAAGYERYEISAWAQHGQQCRHNLNYWQFGDYLGIGAGAHAKISDAGAQCITRVAKVRHPRSWLETAHSTQRISTTSTLAAEDVVLEFAMNALRLEQGFSPNTFTATTGLPYSLIEAIINKGVADGLLARNSDTTRATHRGQRYLNELLQHWMPEVTHNA